MTLAEAGEHALVDGYLDHLERCIVAKSPVYIGYCNLRCYALWCRKDFAAAVEWGRKGHELKSSSRVDTNYECRNNLALAQRDGGDVSAALELFLEGASIAEAISPTLSGNQHEAEFFGNVGRCLWFLGRTAEALMCYRQTLHLLETQRTSMRVMNRGHGHFWVGQALESVGEFELAYCFYREALSVWERIAPPFAEQALACVRAMEDGGRLPAGFSDAQSDAMVRRRCNDWIHK